MTGPGAPIVLNTGCGPPGGGSISPLFATWRQIRVDVDPAAQPDILADIVNLSAIEAQSVDAVWTAHCLEHLYEHDVPQALAEIFRVMKDDAFACILVPDLQRIAAFIAEDRLEDVLYHSPAGPVRAHDVVFGFAPALARGDITMAHRCGFTPTSLARHVTQSDFGGYALLRRPTYELAAVLRKQPWWSDAERDELVARLAL